MAKRKIDNLASVSWFFGDNLQRNNVKILCGYRDKLNSYEAFLNLYHSGKSIQVKENSGMVDGIGGIVWEGSILLNVFLESIILDNVNVLELGCGTGVSGILASTRGANTILTDRYPDLATYNYEFMKQFIHDKFNLMVIELFWENYSPLTIERLRGFPGIIIGSEIACLLKQQHYLVNLINTISRADTVTLLTFDDFPPPYNNVQYEKEMIQKMTEVGFVYQIIMTGIVEWHAHIPADIGDESMLELMNHLSLSPEGNISETNIVQHENHESNKRPRHSREYVTVEILSTSMNTLATPSLFSPKQTRENFNQQATNVHHICAFFRRSAGNTCSRCNIFFCSVLNGPKACPHHPGLYVCRRHPGEVGLSIYAGGGDGLGYYGNGIEGKD